MEIKRLLPLFVLLTFFSFSAKSQCLSINCLGDTVLKAGSNCTNTFNYPTPMGVDTCNPNFFYNFTTCGETGLSGPSQSQANTAYSNTTLSGISVINGVQYWVVPFSTTYTIKAVGAAGGGTNGGLGAGMQGDFALTAGDTILVVVGQEGDDPQDNSATGGGGSYVVKVDNTSSTIMTSTGLKVTPLIIAGGGGANPGTANAACNANITTSGNAGNGATASGAGGINGNGGTIAQTGGNNRAGGGGGFLTDGDRTGTCGTSGTESGFCFLKGSNGGLNSGCSTGYEGGFGGGGGANSSGWRGSGGGGGYSGGGGGQTNSNVTTHRGGGGGSYNVGTNKFDSTGIGTGDGFVQIVKPGNPVMNIQTAGLGRGASFPLGVTTESYLVTDGVDSAMCSFTVTVIDTPVTKIDPFPFTTTCTSSDSIPLPSASPALGFFSGPGVVGFHFYPSVSGPGTHWIVYRDVFCPQEDSTSIVVESQPPTNLPEFDDDTLCTITPAVTIPMGVPAGGVYSGSGVTGNMFDPSQSGSGEIWITYTVDKCQASDSVSVYVMDCTGIDENENKSAFRVAPNPSSGIFNIERLDDSIERLKVYNSTGKLVLNNSFADNIQVIDLSNLPNGLYVLMLESDNGIVTSQLVKE